MIPVLAEISIIDGLTIWQTRDNRVGTGFEIVPCDLETENADAYHRRLVGLMRSLDPNVLGRIKVKSESSYESLGDCSRSSSLSEVGYTRRSVYLFVEIMGEPMILGRLRELVSSNSENRDVQALLKVYELIRQSGLTTKPLSEDQIKSFFIIPNDNWVKGESSITNGTQRLGVLRLVKPSSQPISEETLAQAALSLPPPFEISVSFRRIDARRTRIDLERRLRQISSASDATTDNLKSSTVVALNQNLISGADLFEYEFLFILSRSSEAILSEDISKSQTGLSQFGDFQVETYGVAPSWLSTLIGNSQHVTLKEIDEVLSLMLPIWVYGENHPPVISKRALIVSREDRTVHAFDLLDQRYNVFNSLIVGTSGRGKSVLTGLLTRSLLNDPNVYVIKIDVGGSHSKECELYGGQEYILQLNQSSGINPFSLVKREDVSDSEKIGILSKFLGVLILEQGEVSFSKELRSQIEENINNYLTKAKEPSLQEFYDLQIKFPRRSLLKRWVKSGLYESAFSVSSETQGEKSRLRYFNFSQIFQASDPEFAQAGIAAVLAEFNIEALSSDGRRIVLICDETPFFIKTCFDFFKFSTANVRKYGHAVILITQLSTDLVVNGDTGIIENSPQRFLFSVDGDIESYRLRFGLSQKQVEIIRNIISVPGKYSQVYLQTGEMGRRLRIEITREEYWEHTSSQIDKQKLSKLRTAVPELSLKEAIRCLSAV